MSPEYIICLCFCCFGLGVGVGMAVPFLFCALYNKMLKFDLDIFDVDDNDLSGGTVPTEQKETKQHER